MRKYLVLLAAVFAVGLFQVAPANAAHVVLQYRDTGYIVASEDDGTRTQTRSEVGGNRTAEWDFDRTITITGSSLSLTWTSVVDYGNGDVLVLDGEATGNAMTGVFTSTETIVSGTGRFEGVTGVLGVRGRYNGFDIRMTTAGKITYPHAPI